MKDFTAVRAVGPASCEKGDSAVKQRFDVTGMTCSACSAHVEKAVRACSGVSDVSVNLLQNSMAVEYNDQAVSPDAIIQAVEDAGYGASVHGGAKQAAGAGSGSRATALAP